MYIIAFLFHFSADSFVCMRALVYNRLRKTGPSRVPTHTPPPLEEQMGVASETGPRLFVKTAMKAAHTILQHFLLLKVLFQKLLQAHSKRAMKAEQELRVRVTGQATEAQRKGE